MNLTKWEGGIKVQIHYYNIINFIFEIMHFFAITFPKYFRHLNCQKVQTTLLFFFSEFFINCLALQEVVDYFDTGSTHTVHKKELVTQFLIKSITNLAPDSAKQPFGLWPGAHSQPLLLLLQTQQVQAHCQAPAIQKSFGVGERGGLDLSKVASRQL